MGKQVRLSVIILKGGVKDGDLYRKCKDSVSWADEVVEVETKRLNGSFSEWRNEGLKLANGLWILYVDADEVVSTELRKEIELEIQNEAYPAFAIPRKNIIFGKEMKHCGLYPDYVKRLFKKNSFKKWTGELHEEPNYEFLGTIVVGGKDKIGHLKKALYHYKNMSLSEMVEKTNKWSEVEAKLMFDAHHPKMNFFRFASAGLREFWLRMIVQTAFLDGVRGVIYGLYQVFSRLISYSKLWELQLIHESGNL